MSAEIIDLGNRRTPSPAPEPKPKRNRHEPRNPERLWDIPWGGSTVAELVAEKMKDAARSLAENYPWDAVNSLSYAARVINTGIKEAEKRRLAAVRKERKARKIARTREQLQREMRRIERQLNALETTQTK
jgi:hypothetical protein